MVRRAYRGARLVVAALGAALLAAASAPAGADEPPVHASMQCERAAEPGRVKCSIEARVEPGPRAPSIAWADVAIVELPDFAAALKGRLGREDATARDPSGWRWAFALVARRAGQGEAKARVRFVVCEAGG